MMNGAFDSNDRSAWFFGLMSRTEAISKLQGKSFGTFLIRRSPRNPPNDYVLSVSEIGKIANYIIYKDHDSYRIGDQIFPDVPQLVEHYRVNYLDSTMLTAPLEKDKVPSLPDRPQRANLGYVVAKFDFQGQDEEDLPFKKGEVLEIITKHEEKWWTAQNSSGQSGHIPVPYVEVTNPLSINERLTDRHSSPTVITSFTSRNSESQSRPISLPDSSRPVFAKVIMRRVPNAYDPEALPLEIGDIIKVSNRPFNGQWEGTTVDGRTGHFPFTHVKIVDASEINQG